MRQYKLNTNYFNKIDSHEKAYVLGFLYADGSNRGDGITFTQDVERIDILENIKRALESEAPIREARPGHYIFEVFSDIMVKDIEKLGVVKNKSLVLQFPTEEIVPDEFMSSFVLGYFDGDGTIHKTKSNNGYISYCCGFIGTKELLTWIANYVGYPDTTFSKRYNDNKNNYYIRWGGNNKPLEVLNTFYPLSPVHLDRKYKLYQELLNVVQSRKSIE